MEIDIERPPPRAPGVWDRLRERFDRPLDDIVNKKHRTFRLLGKRFVIKSLWGPLILSVGVLLLLLLAAGGGGDQEPVERVWRATQGLDPPPDYSEGKRISRCTPVPVDKAGQGFAEIRGDETRGRVILFINASMWVMQSHPDIDAVVAPELGETLCLATVRLEEFGRTPKLMINPGTNLAGDGWASKMPGPGIATPGTKVLLHAPRWLRVSSIRGEPTPPLKREGMTSADAWRHAWTGVLIDGRTSDPLKSEFFRDASDAAILYISLRALGATDGSLCA